MPRRPTATRRVAIACLGDGSHTASTVDARCQLLEGWEERCDLVGTGSTSRGAFNALGVRSLVCAPTHPRIKHRQLSADRW
ncbi:hypothetical protein [Haloarcula sp. JP-L23]|uniref:hypothetical protein n=1 Tax=Haloarcula sp. JP-L23 TaxID=2716717 RepID=UPI00140EEBF0|nr:hypothetical protein G9465_13975 [Haloarcula sp. JP-L23]